MFTKTLLTLALTAPIWHMPANASHDGAEHLPMTQQVAKGLMMPEMNAERGRMLFASKGCVVCHSINGVGGEHAPALDAATMEAVMNPFEFAARMWRGAGAMVELQEEELGAQIALSGQDLADIIAFVHDAEEQKKFSSDDIPNSIASMMHRQAEEDLHKEGKEDHRD